MRMLHFENDQDNEILAHWLKKNPTEFWKSWHSKFGKSVCANVVLSGCCNNQDSAEKLANHFRNIYYDSKSDDLAVDSYYNERSLHPLASKESLILSYQTDVELVDQCIRHQHLGKASGPDGLSAEHLVYAHPNLVIHLKHLFSLIFAHGFVPDNFGYGILVPIVKDKIGNFNDVHNYRPNSYSYYQ